MNNNEIKSKVDDLREYRRMIEDLQAEVDAITDAIKQHMSAEGVDEIAGADFKITWKAVTSNRIDGAALKAAYPDIASAFTKSSTSKRFCVA